MYNNALKIIINTRDLYYYYYGENRRTQSYRHNYTTAKDVGELRYIPV